MRRRRFSVKFRQLRVELGDRCASLRDARASAEAERERVRQWVVLRGGGNF